MNKKEQLQKIGEDLVLMEEKLSDVLIHERFETYRHLINIYLDNIKNYSKLLVNIENDDIETYEEKFYIDRKEFILKHMKLVDEDSKDKLIHDEFKSYKRLNHSFQTLIEISNKLEYIVDIVQKHNLKNYQNPNSIISKDLLLDRVTHKTYTITGHSGDNILSIDIGRDDTDNTCITTFMIMNNIPKNTITCIKTSKYNDIADIVNQIKQYKNINKIIINSLGVGQILVDELRQDKRLGKKLDTIEYPILFTQDVLYKLKQDLEDNKLVFYSRCFISDEILYLFKEIQDTEYHIFNNQVRIIRNVGNNVTRWNCLWDLYYKLNSHRKELVD